MKKLRLGAWLKGYSGSPVFLQDRQFKAWRLCGIFVAAWVPNSKSRKGAILALKPEYILQAIN